MTDASHLSDPIADLRFIGDQKTIAAIDKMATLPLLSFPHMDDPTVLSALLSQSPGSRMRLFTLPDSEPISQNMIDDTNRCRTVLRGPDGEWEVMDFMVPGGPSLLVRRITATKGSAELTLEILPAPDYEREQPQISAIMARAARVKTPTGDVVFSASFPLTVGESSIRGEVKLEEGQTAWITIGEAASDTLDLDNLIARTDAYWDSFIEPLSDDLPRPALMRRNALAAGLLHNLEGSCVAAAGTFGFPEAPGGKRNWDYRYVWVRDTAVGAKAMARMGLTELAQTWLAFVMLNNDACDRSPIHLMLMLDGKPLESEQELGHFDGMLGAKPVRIGNDASGQLQLDIFGEMAFALRALCECGATPHDKLLDKMEELLDWLTDNWNRVDSSIWELRGEEKHYLFSRLMCWVAFRDMIHVHEHCGRMPGSTWAATRDEIAENIRDQFWCPNTRSYMQTADCSNVDSAVTAMRVFGFLEADDERWQLSKEEIRRALVKPAGVLRYPHKAEDGFESDDGTFVLCTCWWIEALCMDGEHAEAKLILDDLIARFGPDFQIPEEVGEDGRWLGNMPQLFSQAGLVEAVMRVDSAA